MMKVEISNVSAHVVLHVGVEGSVLAQTVQARGDKIEIHYDIESTDEPAKVAGFTSLPLHLCVESFLCAFHPSTLPSFALNLFLSLKNLGVLGGLAVQLTIGLLTYFFD